MAKKMKQPAKRTIVESQFIVLRDFLTGSIRAAKKQGNPQLVEEAQRAACALLIVENQVKAGKRAVWSLKALNPLLEPSDREWRARVRALERWDKSCRLPAD